MKPILLFMWDSSSIHYKLKSVATMVRLLHRQIAARAGVPPSINQKFLVNIMQTLLSVGLHSTK